VVEDYNYVRLIHYIKKVESAFQFEIWTPLDKALLEKLLKNLDILNRIWWLLISYCCDLRITI